MLRSRPGFSLVELLLFIGLFSLVIGTVLILLFSSSEQRVRQQIISSVDQTGVQMLQTLTRRIRRAERILDPPRGETGAVLALQMAEQEENPTVIGLLSGTLMVGEQEQYRPLSNSGQVLLSRFVARNTSATADHQSVEVSFRIARAIPFGSGATFVRDFSTLVTLFPDDQQEGDACNCTAPSCVAGKYQWQYCENETCANANKQLSCS